MMKSDKTSQALQVGSVVGTIHSPGALQAALTLPPDAVDFLELRVDAFSQTESSLALLETEAGRLPAPKLVTVRRPDEGGSDPALDPARRRALYERFAPLAAWVDVELRSLGELPEVIAAVRAQGRLILSYHDFQKTPALEEMVALAHEAEAAGAQVFKIAARAETPVELARLSRFLAEWEGGLSLAVMGMGPQGKISRLVLGRTGSVLNYGYLDTLQVSGQWAAPRLKELLAEIAGG